MVSGRIAGMFLYRLLRQLLDGRFHSGTGLAEGLGVSRMTVSKYMAQLRTLGLEVHAVRGKGYRLPHPPVMLSREAVLAGLAGETRQKLRTLDVHFALDSTNAYLQRELPLLQLRPTEMAVCLAETQHAGRGRRGRTWISPLGGSLYFSMGQWFRGGAASLEGLSLVVGMAVVDALESLGVQGLMLKWPNDVRLEGAKLSGILLEMVGDVQGDCLVVMGVGLNVRHADEAMQGVAQPWTSLSDHYPRLVDRNRIVASLINSLDRYLTRFRREGFRDFSERWQQLDDLLGRQVTVHTGDSGVLHGISRGVDASGALLVETQQGLKRFHGGEVSLRPGGER